LTGAWELTASDASELAKKLQERTNGAGKGPPRLERRGKHKELERHNLNRFLRGRGDAFLIGFPLHVSEGENPDFVICENGREYGMEITVACLQAEQVRWTEVAKDAREQANDPTWKGPHMGPVGDEVLVDGAYVEWVRNAIAKKTAKCSTGCDQLLVYLNTLNDMFQESYEPEAQLEALSEISVENSQFEKIWVLADKRLFELVSKKFTVGSADRP